MAKLQLQNSALHLDIDGNLFDVALTPAFLGGLQEVGHAVQNVSITGGIEDADAVGQWMSDSLDRLLGAGAAQTIWGDAPNLLAFIPILKYIMDEAAEVMAAQNPQMKQPANAIPMPMNREQRRAVKPPQVPKHVNDVEAAKAVLRAEGYEFTD